MSTASLQGITKAFLDSPDPFRRQVGLAACAMHQVNPGAVVIAALKDENAALHARALRVVANLGLVDHLPACTDALADKETNLNY